MNRTVNDDNQDNSPFVLHYDQIANNSLYNPPKAVLLMDEKVRVVFISPPYLLFRIYLSKYEGPNY